MKYHTILLDADDTLFDFRAAERQALTEILHEIGVNGSETDIEAYSAFNDSLWRKFERGETTKPEIYKNRFQFLLDRFSLTGDPIELNQAYLKKIADCSVLFDDAQTFVETLSKTFTLAIVTNGAEYAQKRRFSRSSIKPYIKYLFVSEEIGVGKPDIRYFEAVFDEMAITDKGKVLIVGDSLASDILGGLTAGIDTCWFNPDGKVNHTDICPTYEIRALSDLYEYLE